METPLSQPSVSYVNKTKINKGLISLIVGIIVVGGFFAFFLFISRTVSGQITDMVSKGPVLGIEIIANRGPKSTTDQNGNYQIKIKGIKMLSKINLEIKTTENGYEPAQPIEINSFSLKNKKDIVLDPKPETVARWLFSAWYRVSYNETWEAMHPDDKKYWVNSAEYQDKLKEREAKGRAVGFGPTKPCFINSEVIMLSEWQSPVSGKKYNNVVKVPNHCPILNNYKDDTVDGFVYMQKIDGYYHFFTGMSKADILDTISFYNEVAKDSSVTEKIRFDKGKRILAEVQEKIKTVSTVNQFMAVTASIRSGLKKDEVILGYSTTSKNIAGLKAWDFSKRAEIVEKDLGVEEINGVLCRRYKVGIKIIPYSSKNPEDEHFLHNVMGIDPAELYVREVTQKFDYVYEDAHGKADAIIFGEYGRDYQISIEGKLLDLPIPEEITMPVMYIAASGPGSDSHKIDVWSITGEIWVDETTFLVHKEKYKTERANFYFSPNAEDGKKTDLIYIGQNNFEVTYSNFK